MENLKRVMFATGAGASAVLFLKGNKSAGFLALGTGLAALAVEYPKAFAAMRNDLPGYIAKGSIAVNLLSRFANRA